MSKRDLMVTNAGISQFVMDTAGANAANRFEALRPAFKPRHKRAERRLEVPENAPAKPVNRLGTHGRMSLDAGDNFVLGNVGVGDASDLLAGRRSSAPRRSIKRRSALS